MSETPDGEATRPWVAFATLAFTAALTILDVSKVGVVLPQIQHSLHGSDSTVQLMVVGYTVAYALFLLPSGRLGDIYPRRTVFLVGSVMFTGASVWCALAPSATILTAGRMAQGAGAGVLMPQVLGLCQHLFPLERRAKPLAILAASTAITSTIGPVIAGLVLEVASGDAGWRMLFWIDVFGECIALPLTWWLLREPAAPRTRGFDWVGMVWLAPAIVLTIIPVSTISSTTPVALWMVLSVAAGLVCVAGFVLHERRLVRTGAEPLVDLRLRQVRHFPAGVIISGLAYANGTAGTLTVTLFYEQYARQSPLETALWMLPSAVSMVFGSWLVARSPLRANRRLIVIGSAVNGVGLLVAAVAMGSVTATVIPAVLAVILLAKSFGGSFSQAPNQVRSLQYIPPDRSSIAGSLLQVSQRIGSALGMAVALIIYYGFGRLPLGGPFDQPTRGPLAAVAVCGGFSLIAAVVAAVDRDPPPTAPEEAAPDQTAGEARASQSPTTAAEP